MSATCSVLESVLSGAVPPVTLKTGESCSSVMEKVYNTRIEGLVAKDYITELPSCPAGLNVKADNNIDTTPKNIQGDPSVDYLLPYPLMFDKTSASCMGAPEMAYESNMNILNGGKVDAWNTARDPGYGMAYFNRTDLPYYYDKVKNPNEADVDCGKTACPLQPLCSASKTCFTGLDCLSKICFANGNTRTCAAAACDDNTLNGDGYYEIYYLITIFVTGSHPSDSFWNN